MPRRTARLRLTLLYECVSIVSWVLRVALLWVLVLIVEPIPRSSLALTLVVLGAIALVVMTPVSMLVEACQRHTRRPNRTARAVAQLAVSE